MSGVPVQTGNLPKVAITDTSYLKFAKYLAGLDPKKPISQKQEAEVWSCMTNAVIGMVMLVLASALVYVASTDPAAASNRMYIYSVLIIMPLLIAAYMMVPSFGKKPSGSKLIGYGIVVCALLIVAYFLMKNMNMKQIVFANYFIMALCIGFAVFLLVILSKVSMRYLMSLEGWTGFIAKLVLYIPCLISEAVMGSIVMMPNIYAKIGLILGYLALFLTIVYYIIDALASTELLRLNNWIKSWFKEASDQIEHTANDTVDQINSVAGNVESFSVSDIPNKIGDIFTIPDWFKQRAYLKALYNTNIHSLNTVNTIDVTGLDENDLFRDSSLESIRTKNYTISAWLYLPAQSASTWTRILALRKASDNPTKEKGTPAVWYSPGKLRIYISNVDINPVFKEIEIAPQKWNHLAFVYNDNVAHFYLNSKLMFSEPLTNVLPTYSFSDELVSGDDTADIVGKVGGLSYVPTTYTTQQVVELYNGTRGFFA